MDDGTIETLELSVTEDLLKCEKWLANVNSAAQRVSARMHELWQHVEGVESAAEVLAILEGEFDTLVDTAPWVFSGFADTVASIKLQDPLADYSKGWFNSDCSNLNEYITRYNNAHRDVGRTKAQLERVYKRRLTSTMTLLHTVLPQELVMLVVRGR